MTVEDMVTEIWEHIGEPSDLDPFDVNGDLDETSDGYGRMLKWINRGYKRIVNWKFPNGRQIRFYKSKEKLNFKMPLETGTAQTGTASSITLAGAESSINDFYLDWVVELTSGTGSGQRRLVTDYAGSTRVADVNRDFDTTPDSDTVYALYKRFMKFVGSSENDTSVNIVLDPIKDIIDVLKVTDLKDRKDLIRAERTDNFSGSIETEDTPGNYFRLGNELHFDRAVSDERWYRMEYERNLAELTASTDEPKIPDIWHEAIVLWCTRLGLKRAQDYKAAYAVKRDLEDFMNRTKQAIETSTERETGYLEVEGD